MASLETPRLRPLSARRVSHLGREYVALEDPRGLFLDPVLVTLEGFQTIVRRFDGQTSLEAIRQAVRQATGQVVPPGQLEAMVAQLDASLVLESPTLQAFLDRDASETVRPAAFAGRSYPADPAALRLELDRYFTHPAGAGRPGLEPVTRRIRGILSPHIDFGRGGPTYSWAYRALIEGSDADVFVVLGVAHKQTRRRFVMTRKDFATPLGTVATDRGFVDQIAQSAGMEVFEDQVVHRNEHSLEFQMVFLQHLLGGRRAFQVVPILVGSFHDLTRDGRDPMADPEVARMIQALRDAEANSGRKVAYIGGIDLCHVGPEFGDPDPVDDATLEVVKGYDGRLLDRARASDASGWFATGSEGENRWRVCGLAATYTLLQVIGPASGRVLRYDQAVNPSRTCCVTFASVAYEQPVDER
jgi:AmmeMemoRadiSam system protein B